MTVSRLVYHIHKWAGLLAGAVLIVVGLTGSVIVFDDELDRWLNPRLLRVAPGKERLPVDGQVAAASAAFTDGKLDGIYLPTDGRAVTEVYFETEGHEHWLVAVDPYANVVLGKRTADGGLIRFIYSLHFTLALRPWGDLVVGIVGIAFLVSSMSGLWVLRRTLARPFTVGVRFGQGGKRPWSDLHKLVGVATVAFHLVFAVSGVYMMLYAFDPAFLSAEQEALDDQASARRPEVTLSHDAMLATVRKALAGFEPAGLSMPQAPGDPVLAYGRVAGSNPIWGPYSSSVELHAVTGKVLRTKDIRKASLLDRYETVLYQLHFGQYGGEAVRALYVVLGLMPGALAVSGFVLWWKRRRRGIEWARRPVERVAAVVSDGAVPGLLRRSTGRKVRT
jgi:uncharacterized iron-regulated membrane protein